ncbi:BMP family protein [Streptomyces sp. VRA16 Mangrove soil]|uniref:BMP family lipoprotein n=1 Tax=Streptomyces sp. VRA16 Mangrove soil TaxID=2817434 RepID=UPI001A9E89F1|nr:BMP family ABC transporter substrate-binding protein [Streptomyces sp. VRA16 Mangrove soil]MBO1334798.1 BMP family ABC transporter substrate-binding protein [Streptomyces sp. VRA16 Mangrove soil]
MRRVSRIAVAGTATASLALVLSACGGTSSDASSKSSGGKDKGLAIAYDVGGKGDQSFNDAAYEGLQKAKAKFGYEVADQEPKDGESDDDKTARLVNLAKAGYNPIVGIGYSYAPAVAEAAKKYPNTTFGIVDDASVKGDNIADLVFQENEVSYLAGVTAALKTKTNTVGFVGGVDNALINKFRAGFEQGVKDTKKGVKVEKQFLDEDPAKGFASPDLGKAAAEKQIEDGADVVYHAAGLSGQGVIEAAAAEKKYAIGVDSDQYSQKALAAYKKYIITSATKGVAESIFKLAESVKDGKPQTGVITGDLKSGEVSLADSNPEFKNDSKLQAALKKAEAGIIDGSIKVAAK